VKEKEIPEKSLALMIDKFALKTFGLRFFNL
jgi:hypothetical protein